MTPPQSNAREGILIGAAVVAAAGVMAWQASDIPTAETYAQVGPETVPWIVTAALGVLGVAIAVFAILGRWRTTEAGLAFQRGALAWLAVGLLLNLVLIDRVGFILASTVLFACTARAFGSARIVRDAAIGFVIAAICYVGFDRVLGYEIGSGVIESFL